ncbi:hypothetical protein BC937DRAFT_90104 [Endogone sp. FLAS-F59071]|nr:hypothetical protein BC937DRAFT_90104 [Endogone sp. FLAS-F59071]|eukprot:RUS17340.1 hypothetical protein BC937DRAFT_90104 [Endogone sp. FLAS-F59071]
MDQHTDDYNARLLGIRDDYAAANYTDFGVIYQSANLDVASMPVEFFSNIDCFHPSLLAHTFVAKQLW